MLAAADVTLDFDWLSPAELTTSSPRLRWVQATSSGIGEFVRRHGLADSGITFTTAAGVHAVPLAEFAVAGALHFVKELPELRRAQHERRWQRRATRLFAGRRVTVVGLGAVGHEVARSFEALRADVAGVGRDGRDRGLGPGVRTVAAAELDQVLAGTDVLVLCCPLTPQTHHLLDRRRLSLMPPEAIVINLSRGDVIEEPALIEALQSGMISAACLDVFSTEPLPEASPLWQLDNVIVSPHSASTVDEENRLITDLFCMNLENWLGRPAAERLPRRPRLLRPARAG